MISSDLAETTVDKNLPLGLANNLYARIENMAGTVLHKAQGLKRKREYVFCQANHLYQL